jgi:carboxypeptidase Q
LEALGRKQIAGKILLFNNRFDQRMAAQGLGGEAYEQAVVFRSRGAIDASYFGAVAVLVRSVGGGGYRLPHTGITAYDPAIPKIPAGAVTAEDADLIAGLAARGKVQARLVLTPQSLPETTSYNVVADLKGTEHPEQVVIVSGHLDSWDLGTGALDDAAGVAMAMAAVELVRRLDLRPRRTIRVVAWMGEECGSPGAWAYAKQHEGELAHHVAAIESDLGAGHPVGFKAKIKDKAMAWLSPVSAILDAQGAGGIRPVDGTEADLTPLAYAGVPAFGLWQDSRTYFNFHHTAADTIDKIVPAELAENAAAMVVMAYALANATEPLLR